MPAIPKSEELRVLRKIYISKETMEKKNLCEFGVTEWWSILSLNGFGLQFFIYFFL